MHHLFVEVLIVPVDVADPSGAEVVHKTACLPGERERLLHEAEVLRLAAQRDVTGLARVVAAPSPDDSDPVLITAAAAGPSLAVAGPLPVLEVAGVAAEVARLLAGLHDAGLVHGAVEPGHVVLDGARGAILVGLGHGGETGALPCGGDPAPAPPARLDPAADIAGWGALVTHLLDWSATAEEEPLLALRRALGSRPNPRRRARTPTPAAEVDRRALAALADQAQDPDPARRPTARSLAAAVAHRIPQCRLPGAAALPVDRTAPAGLLDRLSGHLTPTGEGPMVPRPEVEGRSGGPAWTDRRDDAPDRRRRSMLLARRSRSVGPERLAVLASGKPDDLTTSPEGGADDTLPAAAPAVPRRGCLWFAGAPLHRRLVAGGAALLALVGVVVAARASLPEQVAAPAPRCPAVAEPSADVDLDGCREAVTWSEGVLQAGAARFALGAAGDGWAVGDWDCDGQPTPALLHAGSLAVFDTWPGPGVEERGRPVATVPGARQLSVVSGPDGCDRPSLSRPGAADLLIDPRGTP
jgi:hypothetical protein